MANETFPGEYIPSSDELLDRIPEELGFTETVEMHDLRKQMIHDYMVSRELGIQTKLVYQRAAEAVIDETKGDAYSKAQLGLAIRYALVKRDAGLNDDYSDELNDALEYAYGLGLTGIVALMLDV